MNHDEIIREVEDVILKNIKAETKVDFSYRIERSDFFYIDLLVLINFKLFIFEIKTGAKENKARKQLEFHKKAFINSQKRGFPFGNIFFSRICAIWISYENQKITNIETNEQTDYKSFINNPLNFLLRE